MIPFPSPLLEIDKHVFKEERGKTIKLREILRPFVFADLYFCFENIYALGTTWTLMKMTNAAMMIDSVTLHANGISGTLMKAPNVAGMIDSLYTTLTSLGLE